MAICDCIEKLGIAIRKKYGESAEFTNTYITMNFNTGAIDTALEPINFRYHPKKVDGSLSKKWEKSHIVFNFCPICGVEIRPPKVKECGQ